MAQTPASVASHPIHPILIPFPIGLLVFSFVCDVIVRAGWGTPVWHDVAFFTMAGGVIGALVAAVPGFIDYLSLVRRPATANSRVAAIATTHMALNLTVVVLYVVNLILRTRSAPDAALPFWLSLLGVVLLGMSGYLGGALVFEHRVGVTEHSTSGSPAGTGVIPSEATAAAGQHVPASPAETPPYRRAG